MSYPFIFCLRLLFLSAIATALFAVFCNTINLSNSDTISLGDKELRNRIAKNGYDIVKEKHTFKQRAKTVLDILNGIYDEQSI